VDKVPPAQLLCDPQLPQRVPRKELERLTPSSFELRRHGILVNSICPGWVATDMGGSGGRPVAEGAKGIVRAALLLDNGPTIGFFRDGQPLDW
jgi:NAD(P)-dependent dehydrogenase (short-subunit alcohol dehydrogenase family)